jgi:cytochrome c-type biogenesis protein CcmH
MKLSNYKLQITHSVLLAFAFILAALLYQPAFAQGSTPTDDEVNAVAHKLYCPVCESTPLDVCPTDACKDWRELIRTMLADGKSEAEILQHFENQYGARVLAEPPKQGFYWLVYVLPPALILVGAFILFRSMKEWTSKTDATNPIATSSAKDDYVARFEDELKKRK